MKKNIITVSFCLTAIGLIACHQAANKNETTAKRENSSDAQDRLQHYNTVVCKAINLQAKTGNIITRLGRDITSEMIRQINQHDKTYSHVGIASLENDTLFVYHALGGEFNPDQKLLRESIWQFAHPLANKKLGLFAVQMSFTENQNLLAEVKNVYAHQIPFDMDFDLSTNSRLYCAEFVGKCFEKALKGRLTFNRTIIMDKPFLNVDDITHNLLVQPIGSWQY